MSSISKESYKALFELFVQNSTLNETDYLLALVNNGTTVETMAKMLQTLKQSRGGRDKTARAVTIITAYSAVTLISFIGNLLVCYIILTQRSFRRNTTNLLIANLTASDILMTVLNIPFNCIRFLMDNWVFGQMLCSALPFVQVTTVYVSTFTMICIAVDRYQAIIYPLKPRIADKISKLIIIAFIWLMSCLFSLPYVMFNQVKEIYVFRPLIRCQTNYPQPSHIYRKSINVFTFLSQYLIPVIVNIIIYTKLSFSIWFRRPIGVVTASQRRHSFGEKKKTVKMLSLVVVVFTVCWFPINIYHILVDFEQIRPNFLLLVACHWIAMTSVCYNPFIYFWLNPVFRYILRYKVLCCFNRQPNSTNHCSSILDHSHSLKEMNPGNNLRRHPPLADHCP